MATSAPADSDRRRAAGNRLEMFIWWTPWLVGRKNSGGVRLAASLHQRQRAQHLVGQDHETLVSAYARLGQHKVGAGGERDLRRDAGRNIGFVGSAAQAAAHAVRLAIQHRLDAVVDR